MHLKLNGVLPAMLTPMSHDGTTVDSGRAGELALRLAGTGVQGLFICGTTGEGLLMSVEERKRVLEAVLSAVGGRLAVIAHVGCLNTADTIALTVHAAEAGATAGAVVTPAFYDYDVESLVSHYMQVGAAAPDFPLFLYNIPACAKNALEPKLVNRLAHEIPNIVGVKDSSGHMGLLIRLILDCPHGFQIVNGVDAYTFQARVSGAHASIASGANIAPEPFLTIYDAAAKGDYPTARAAQERISRIAAVFPPGSLIACYKEALRLLGFDAGGVRAPQRPLTDRERAVLALELESLGLIG